MTTNKQHQRITLMAGETLPADPTITGDCTHGIDPYDPGADVELFHLRSGEDVLLHRACGGIISE